MKKRILFVLALILGLAAMPQTYTVKRTISPQEKLNNQYCTGIFKNTEGTIIDLANDNGSAKAYLNILEWLQGRIAGLQVYYRRDGTPVAFIRNAKASLFIDEIPADEREMSFLAVSDIAMIKIFKGPFWGGFANGTGGAIAIYTIQGDDEEFHDE